MSEVNVESRINSPHNKMEKKDSAYKRSNKPFMEKKRRARINNCLSQLKTLVLQAMRKDTNQYSKLEKADILEMTVKHLRQLQRQQVSQAMTCDPTVVTKYKAGFNECANEVVRYLSSVQGVETDTRHKLLNHLGNIVTQVNHQGQEQCQQPLNVQIPSQANQQGLQNVQNGCLLMPAGVQAVHTSPLVLQSVQNINTSNIRTQGQSPQNLYQRVPQNQQQYGSFQIVPSINSPTAVAVYLGQSQNIAPNTETNTSTLNNLNRSPPRTKASLKAFDSSAFSQVSNGDKSNNSSPSCSPMSQETSSFTSSNLNLNLHGLALQVGRTPSPLKVEDVWRPW
ncbi:hypothetical protein ACF0H5_020006 [Mactra antiquata]